MADKKDIGNLHNVLNSGVDLAPANKRSLQTDKEKGQKAFYKGEPMKYMDYIQEVGERVKRNKEHRGIENGSKFAGVNFNNAGKIIR